MKVSFSEGAWNSYQNWITTDKKTAKKISALIKSIIRTPFAGSGNPEALKYELSGF